MFHFPLKKLLVVFSLTLLLVTGLKAAVDTCLPNVSSRIFPKTFEQDSFVCSQLMPWVVWSKTQQARITGSKNFYNEGPSSFEDDDGSPSVILFSDSFRKLPELLAKVPEDRILLWQIIGMAFIISVLIAVFWEWAATLAGGPPVDPTLGEGYVPKGKEATEKILPTYLEKNTESRRPPGKRS